MVQHTDRPYPLDSQNEAVVHYLIGYITEIRLPGWSRAFYRDISTQITHGSLVLRIHLTFESFRNRPSTRVGIDRHAIVRTICVFSVIVGQTSATVPDII